MARRKSSQRWLKEHFDDVYVKRAQAEGYRSRAVYKLMEIQQKNRLLKPGQCVVDLGAAPGGWTQYAVSELGAQGILIATDILPMDPVAGAWFLQGDFTELATYNRLVDQLGGRKPDIVLSDMAPNISGVDTVDQPRAAYLSELAVEFSVKALSPQGNLLIKLFQGAGFDALVRNLRGHFSGVKFIKPKASRPRSREIYVLARALKK